VVASARSRKAAAAERSALASKAETLVARHLEGQGFEIVERNARLGHLEIDIIARRRSLLVFCEVRARTSDRLMTPAQSVVGRKAERFRRAAAAYLASVRPRPREVRLDVASVVYDVPEGRLDYYEAAL
jgi:putative endonuclease